MSALTSTLPPECRTAFGPTSASTLLNTKCRENEPANWNDGVAAPGCILPLMASPTVLFSYLPSFAKFDLSPKMPPPFRMLAGLNAARFCMIPPPVPASSPLVRKSFSFGSPPRPLLVLPLSSAVSFAVMLMPLTPGSSRCADPENTVESTSKPTTTLGLASRKIRSASGAVSNRTVVSPSVAKSITLPASALAAEVASWIWFDPVATTYRVCPM